MTDENEKIEKSSDLDGNGKITINTSADLYKIPISLLKRTKVYNFKGKYYDKIYKEALDLEREKVFKKPPKEKKTPISSYQIPQYEKPKNIIQTPEINQPNYSNQNYNNYNTFSNNNDYNKNSPQNYTYGGYTNFTYNSNQMLRGDYLIKRIEFEIQQQTDKGEEIGIIGSLNELGRWNQDKVLKLNFNDSYVWNKEIPYVNGTDFEFNFIFISHGKVVKWEEGKNRPFKYDNVCLNLRNGNKQSGLITVWNLNHMTLEYDMKTNCLKIICDWNKK